MLISFLKKEDEDGESKSKFMGKGDIIFLLALAIIIGGIWYYNKSTKETAYSHYAKCDVLFATDSLDKAKECYESALDLGYRTDSLDSIGYNRMKKIDSALSLQITN